ncbi:hypothetical protein [Caproiciproducens faecalis]|uniref:Cyclic lactone autoinducer peptide n=1 Tax=Caproiciproducens faecalis TaxID=2820301 RepID=A0ABS7DJU7_9FIRM|nr:hypothetical protein [Caproiciproducens faecalis]MBW7571572.1 hypothetical protein [Caproiciproducens faecalis]
MTKKLVSLVLALSLMASAFQAAAATQRHRPEPLQREAKLLQKQKPLLSV